MAHTGPRPPAVHPNRPAQSVEKTRIDFDSEGHAQVGRGSEALKPRHPPGTTEKGSDHPFEVR
eukprot:CAMPEP_0119474938 /NCGR_PEP_ID=MMETSP1344-20130328/6003_1 /TAXON_ID=236787 /ORGANISM="Florenciella parvula, Strain CCMP2471" /LENGTH=62 /DNA_ID=CAMNT_0007508331 /DNA_START=140 /DNA_END=328 /DNA_ORIENTATION=-